VVKENFSRDMVALLSHDVRASVHALTRPDGSLHPLRPRRRPHC
jgi:hypothetical protein